MSVATARQAFFEVARTEGARYLFTNPGTTELPIFDEFADGDAGIELIMCLQEAVAVGAADGYAQATGRPSLVNLHILPGLANGLCHMANAMWSRSPVVVTAGQQDTRNLVLEPMLAGDLVRVAAPFTKWQYECRRPDEVAIAMRRAFKVASEPPSGPTFVSIPWDTLDEPAGELDVPPPSHVDFGGPASMHAIEDAVRRLLAAEKPLVVAGDGVARADAVPELVAFVEAVGARVVGEPIHGRLVFPHDHPLWAGAMYPINAFIRAVISQYDVTFIAGANVFAPLHPSPAGAVPADAHVVQLDADPYEIGKTYPVELGMTGDPKATLAAMTQRALAVRTPAQAGAIEERTKRWGEERAAGMRGIEDGIAQSRDVKPIKPMVAVSEVLGALPSGTAIVDDAVTSSVQVRTLMRSSEPGTYFFTRGGGLGWGMPASIGVKLAMPDRPVVAVVGDGTALYAPQALWTMAHHEVPVVNVVLNNRTYLILKQGMHSMAAKAAKAGVYPAMDIVDPSVDFPSLAASFGIAAERVDAARDIGPAVASALKSGKPALVEIDVDGAVG